MAYPGNPTINNVTLTSANTEYSLSLPNNTYKLMIKCRTFSPLKISFISGESSTNYFTIPSSQVYWEDNINSAPTIYMQSETAGVVAEILTWT